MKRTSIIFLLAFLVLSLSKVHAQALAANYSFSSSVSTYSPISNGNILGDDTNDDNLFDDIPIGFTFTYCGVPQSSVYVSSNGYFKFGSTINVATQIPIGNSSSDNNIVAGLAADLASNTNGSLTYTTIGTSPNQVFILQWEDYSYYGELDNFYFQMRLYETSNVIEMHYDYFYCDNVPNAYEIGLRGNSFTDYNNRSAIETINTWATSTAGSSQSDFCELTPTPFVPTAGQRYVWSPPCTQPSLTTTASSPTVCLGLPVTFTASGAASYTWNTNATTNTIMATPTVNTTYTVIGSSATSCTVAKTVTVGVVQGPVIQYNAQPSASYCPGMSGTLVATGATAYTWNPSGSNFAIINIIPTTNTTYTIIGTNPQGCATTTLLSIYMTTCTGIYDPSYTIENVRIFPNPSNGQFVVELANGLEKHIEVMDVTGRIVVDKKTTEDRSNVNISNLPTGVYYVRLRSNGDAKVFKVIKE
jgi:hypothetical protein